MDKTDLTSRRAVVGALAGLTTGMATAGVAQRDERRRPQSDVLVACFSRSGNTRVVAGLIQRALKADFFEIAPAVAYPEDYLQTVDMARQERDDGRPREVTGTVADLQRYRTVYLGFPIWGETAPPVIKGFLAAHDLSGKTLVPLITHGGYGLGSSLDVLRKLAPRARLQDGFVMQGEQERRTMNQVNDWLRRHVAG